MFVGDEVASFELIFIRVLAISLSTTIFVYVLTVGKVNLNNQARTPKHVLDTSNAKFLTDNLPSEIGINILSMHAEDHYLRIVTDKGEALILMRLRDAIASMGEDAGIQTHRSHWVSATSTPVMIKQNGKPALELRDGRTVPVSRHYLRAVRHHCDAR
jgi:DNA-binding LytR/AlgR family response regulator